MPAEPAAMLISVVLLGSAAAWLWAFGQLSAGKPLLAYEPRRVVPWDLVDVGLTLLMVIASQGLAAGVVRATFDVEPGTPLETLTPDQRAAVLLASSLATLVSGGLSLTLILLRTRASGRDLGWLAAFVRRDLMVGTVAFLMLAPLVYGVQLALVQIWPSEHPLIELLKDEPDAKFFLLSGFSAVLVAPLVEEYLFRVLLQGWLEKVTVLGGRLGWVDTAEHREHRPVVALPTSGDGPEVATATESAELRQNPYLPPGTTTSPVTAAAYAVMPAMQPGEYLPAGNVLWRSLPILLSGLLFALAHLSHGPDWVALLVLALGLGYVYQRTHRILPAIVIHFQLNATSLAMLLFNVYGAELPN